MFIDVESVATHQFLRAELASGSLLSEWKTWTLLPSEALTGE